MFGSGNKQKKVSFFAKEETECPICKTKHNREELLSGGGRLIAGKLTGELRRLYQESKKYGLIYPLSYTIQVCPRCLYASYPKDFNRIKETEVSGLKQTMEHRVKLVDTLFNTVNFKEPRTMVHGAASMVLAVDCYHIRDVSVAPTIKKAVASLRAAWLLSDLYQFASYRPYDKAADFYYMESVRNYQKTLELMQTGHEPVEAESYMLGPDLDKNWGYDGVIYLNALLTKKYLDRLAHSKPERKDMLERSKRYLSKLYGSGKSSRSKPSVIVDMAKDLYDELGDMIQALEEEA